MNDEPDPEVTRMDCRHEDKARVKLGCKLTMPIAGINVHTGSLMRTGMRIYYSAKE